MIAPPAGNGRAEVLAREFPKVLREFLKTASTAIFRNIFRIGHMDRTMLDTVR